MICNRQPSNDDTLGFAAAHTSSESNMVLAHLLHLPTGSRETQRCVLDLILTMTLMFQL